MRGELALVHSVFDEALFVLVQVDVVDLVHTFIQNVGDILSETHASHEVGELEVDLDRLKQEHYVFDVQHLCQFAVTRL